MEINIPLEIAPMDNVIPVLKTKIIPAYFDRYWEDGEDGLSGLGQRKVLLLVAEPTHDEMLQRLVVRCGLTAADYHILKVRDSVVPSWHKLKVFFNPSVVILLGVLPAQTGVSALFSYGVPNRFGDAVWIPGPSAADMEQKPELRKQLWDQALSPVFVAGTFGKI